MTDQRATHPCDGCGTYTADRVCPSCWGTTDDPMWCRLCNGVCQEGPGCSPMREDRMATEAQNTPVSAHGLPSAGLEGQDATQETPDATEAAQERVERYAEAIVAEIKRYPTARQGWATMWGATERTIARAVIAVADQEQAEKDATIAELRAEVERLRAFNVQIAESNAARLHAALEREEAAKVNGFRMAERLSKVESALFAAWDAGNAVGLDGYIGPNRGEEPDREAILARSGCVAKQLAILDAPKDTTAP